MRSETVLQKIYLKSKDILLETKRTYSKDIEVLPQVFRNHQGQYEFLCILITEFGNIVFRGYSCENEELGINAVSIIFTDEDLQWDYWHKLLEEVLKNMKCPSE